MLLTQRNRIILISLFILIAFSHFGYAQDDVIRVDSSLVTVPAIVLDRDGRYVANLKKEDFLVFEDGVEQEVALFDTTTQPITVLLLLDRSGSMSYRQAELANAASVFVKQLRPDDQLIAATFANQVDVLFKARKIKELNKGIKIQQHADDNSTMIYDAVEFALKKMKKVAGRKAIVLFSDGEGNGIFASAKDNLRDAEEGEAIIYTIQFTTKQGITPLRVNKKLYDEAIETAHNYMHDLAEKTGGRHYQIENIASLEQTFGAIAAELGQQYSLGYYPTITGKQGERRRIKVKMRQPNLVVRARESYVIDSKK